MAEHYERLFIIIIVKQWWCSLPAEPQVGIAGRVEGCGSHAARVDPLIGGSNAPAMSADRWTRRKHVPMPPSIRTRIMPND